MRDILLIIFVLGFIPTMLLRPHVGVLMWSWLGYMNPHRLTWGFAYSFPFAAVVGGVTLIGLVFSKEKKQIPWSPVSITLLLFIMWMFITTLFAIFPEDAKVELIRVVKIQLMTFITMMLMIERDRIEKLVWVIVISLGFYGVKGGIFTILTSGNYRVWGPEGSFIEGNNEIALALIMVLPLMRYLHMVSINIWAKWGLVVTMVLTGVTIIGTHSRGALVAGVVMMALLWYRGRQKVVIAVAILVAVFMVLSFMPQHWFDRMGTIQTYEEDRSAMGRINVWKFAFEVAKDKPLVGGGYGAFDRSLYYTYLPEIANDPTTYIAADAHSIYFEILGEHGFVGLMLFLLLGILVMRSLQWTRKSAQGHSELKWVEYLGSMLQVSIIGYAASGAFLGLAYFDLYYHLIAISVVINFIVVNHLKVRRDGVQLDREKPARENTTRNGYKY